MRVHWTPLAIFALNDAAEYIGQDNPPAARALVKHVKKSVNSLSRFPNQERLGRVPGTREFIPGKYPYIIAYRVMKQRIELLDVIHTFRLWPEAFPTQ